MCRPNQNRWLAAQAVFAAMVFVFQVPSASLARAQADAQVPTQAPEQTMPSLSVQSTTQAPGAGSAQNPAALPAQVPEIAGLAQPPAPVVQPPSTPEDIGDTFVAQLHYQAGIAAYRKDPHPTAEIWNKMGIAYQLMFNVDEAARCYQTSLRLDPKNARVMNNLGTIYDSEKEYSNAERMYRKALKIDSRSGLIYKNLGTNLLSQHKYKKGWEMYKTALEIDPKIFTNSTSPRVQNPASVEERGAMNYYMAKGCVRAGMNDCAIDYLRMALNEGFTNPKKIEADSEFAGLKGLPAFQQLLASQRQQ